MMEATTSMASRSLSPQPPTIITPSSNGHRGIVVFSGGSAANSLVDVFNKVAEQQASHLSYVIPISDNGGSTSELIRVFGGPGRFSVQQASWTRYADDIQELVIFAVSALPLFLMAVNIHWDHEKAVSVTKWYRSREHLC